MADKSEQIKEALADLILDTLKNGKVVEIEGIPCRVTPDAAFLNVARQFIKDFPPGQEPMKAGALKGVLEKHAKKLPFSTTGMAVAPN